MIKKTLLLLFISTAFQVSSQELSELYKKVSSSVVVINTVSIGVEGEGETIQLVNQEALGSGVLISKEGYIWTAAHVVQLAEKVAVEFLDGSIYEAEVISSNNQADIALIKIVGDFNLKNKNIAKIGDSDNVLIGEDVFVLGAPHGFKQSLSRGILSGRYTPQHLSNDFVKIEFLQTDAAINPGNSGGPMFNMRGEVIGIASRIYTNSGGFEGIGFAMTSNIADKLLMTQDNIWTGMESVLVTGNIAKALNVPQDSGLLIVGLSTKGAGSKLGLRSGYISSVIDGVELLTGGDIILEIAGIKLENTNSLFLIRNKLNNSKTGETVNMLILREGKIGEIEFTVNN